MKMKKNTGFTLVELLGILGIIATILVFVMPSLIGMLKRDEEKEYNRFLKDLYLATESYVELNSDSYPDLKTAGGSYTITMKELIDNGYIKSSTLNPRTEKVVTESDTIKITKQSDGSYKYQYTVG